MTQIDSLVRSTCLVLVLLVPGQMNGQERNFEVDSDSNCNNLPATFNGIEHAVKLLNQSEFILTQNFKIRRKKGLQEGKYYSCNNQTGYLVLLMDSIYTVYLEVKKNHWDELTTSNDPDYYVKQEINAKYSKIE